jgi:hypothetical protein
MGALASSTSVSGEAKRRSTSFFQCLHRTAPASASSPQPLEQNTSGPHTSIHPPASTHKHPKHPSSCTTHKHPSSCTSPVFILLHRITSASPTSSIPHLTLLLLDLDHTADVQCHSWGATMTAAFENMAPCMFNYMTDLVKVEEDPEETVEMKVEGKPFA